MEEQILEILLSKDDWDQDKASTANEIAGHFHSFFDQCDGVDHREVDYLLQAYHYWLINKK